MPFPEIQRVLYERNPIVRVICQLRFPSILRIESELPAAFQECIRREYPLFKEKPAGGIELPADLVKMINAEVALKVGGRSYTFVSKDDVFSISLTRDFLALTANAYDRWENFRQHLDGPHRAMVEVYQPAFYTRIGLRYRDVIK